MEKSALISALSAGVAFLLPVGVYCLILASINRRTRPVLVNGFWDSVGLLFAASGFLFATIPMLFKEFYRRTATAADGDQIFTIWLGHWGIWLVYYLLIISGGILMLLWRGHKTMIYNVDLDLLSKAMEQALAALGLEAHRTRERIVLAPANPVASAVSTAFTESARKPVSVPSDRRHGELDVESFPSMCHVTLHWRKCAPAIRLEIERELRKSLESAAPLDNPAAGWFMSVSGLILGAVTAIAVAIGFLMILPGR